MEVQSLRVMTSGAGTLGVQHRNLSWIFWLVLPLAAQRSQVAGPKRMPNRSYPPTHLQALTTGMSLPPPPPPPPHLSPLTGSFLTKNSSRAAQPPPTRTIKAPLAACGEQGCLAFRVGVGGQFLRLCPPHYHRPTLTPAHQGSLDLGPASGHWCPCAFRVPGSDHAVWLLLAIGEPWLQHGGALVVRPTFPPGIARPALPIPVPLPSCRETVHKLLLGESLSAVCGLGCEGHPGPLYSMTKAIEVVFPQDPRVCWPLAVR